MRYFLFFLIFILMSSAYAATPLDADFMESRVIITNTVSFEPDGASYSMDRATGTLTWFPRQTALQDVVSLNTTPDARKAADTITFQWNSPREEENIAITSVVRTRSAIVPVRERIPFPLSNIPPEVAVYLDEGEITDQSREIQILSAQLAAGKDDAYDVVYTLADWTTTNVNYSLASVGQPAIQTSSEVLESRYGKCDELTALFISMNRALGIPARFVAGYSYTTSPQFSTNWGGHGWAEVWLPEHGWVPFDVTYGEYGYLDASHIALKTAPDAKETSIDYAANGRDFELRTRPLNITVVPVRLSESHNTDISITLSTPQSRIGFGSAALILARVKNNKDHYVSTRLDISRTENVQILSGQSKNILLKPRQEAVVPFLVRIDDDLASGYRYTFPFSVSSRLGPSGRLEIIVDENAPVFDESAYAEEMESYTQAVTPAAFTVFCDRSKAAYINESINHTCTVNGADAVRVCDSLRTCSNNGKTFTITTQSGRAGVFTKVYTATAEGESVKFYITSKVVAQTTLKTNLSAPSQASPDDEIDVQLGLSSTGAQPKNITIMLRAPRGEAQQQLDDLAAPAILSFAVPASALRPGENEITTTISYTDEIGTARTDEVRTIVTLVNVGFGDRVKFWFEDIGYWIGELL